MTTLGPDGNRIELRQWPQAEATAGHEWRNPDVCRVAKGRSSRSTSARCSWDRSYVRDGAAVGAGVCRPRRPKCWRYSSGVAPHAAPEGPVQGLGVAMPSRRAMLPTVGSVVSRGGGALRRRGVGTRSTPTPKTASDLVGWGRFELPTSASRTGQRANYQVIRVRIRAACRLFERISPFQLWQDVGRHGRLGRATMRVSARCPAASPRVHVAGV